MYESEDKMVSHPEHYMSKTGMEDGSRVRSYYIGFRTEKFEEETIVEKQEEKHSLLHFDSIESVFDRECSDCPAQYATEKETPSMKWDNVKTKLSDLNTSQIHYVKVPENHIVIDFDIPDKDGNKSFERNVEEASKWPATYAELVQAVLTAINGKQGEFQTSGSTLMIKFIAGVRSKDGELRTAFTTTLSGAITSIKDYYGEFKSAGSYLVDGFCNGISENTWKAEAKARAMAAAAAEAAEDELDEHSPSKRFYGIGNFAGVGFINALIDNVSKAGKAGREIAKSSIDGLNDVISRIADYVDADMDVQPTIRPVLDLSAVEAGTGRLNTLFSRNQALSVSTGMNKEESDASHRDR